MRKLLLIPFAALTMLAQTATPPPVTAPAPLNLTHEEELELEVLQLKRALLQANISSQYRDWTDAASKYQEDTLKNHPGAKYQFNTGSVSWSPIPQAPPTTAKAPVTTDKKEK